MFKRTPIRFSRSPVKSEREVDWVGLPGGEEWLLRPVERGMLKYIDLINGSVHIEDVALCNDYLSVIDENERRYQEANE
jgi:hypothetical protein